MKNWKYQGYVAKYQLMQSKWWWNEELIVKYLFKPDLIVPNYLHDPSQSMKLYKNIRVYEIEKSIKFKEDILVLYGDRFSEFQASKAILNLKKEKNKYFRDIRLKRKNLKKLNK